MPQESPVVTISLADELLRAGRAGAGPQILAGYKPYAIVPEGYSAVPLEVEPPKPLPNFIEQTVRVVTAESFIKYVSSFRTPRTRVFASPINLENLAKPVASVSAYLDYHDMTPGLGGVPQRNKHVVQLDIAPSYEWQMWMGNSGRQMSQLDFAKFIEDHGCDINSPDSATLMELILNFENRSEVRFQSKVNRTTGARILQFSETVESGREETGSIKVPDSLEMYIPVLEGLGTDKVTARMEYRTSNSKLTVAFVVQQPHLLIRNAVTRIQQDISEELECEILSGKLG